MWTLGIGPEAKGASYQLKILATNPRYALSGDVETLVQKPVFTMLSGGLLKSKINKK